ncbi:MAG: hypothetical protein MZV70_16435 [Desulfobacterales bacterium]|nr:hypothetical protein [Desulfobacterales bacterium]
MVQEEDLTVDGAMTDVKGDRGLAPRQAGRPGSVSARCGEERQDGIVVRGAKAHQTGAVNSHWILVMPTIAMRKEDADLCRILCRARQTPRASPTSTDASPATPASSKAARLTWATSSSAATRP